ncbi:hypothetical protein TNCV_2225151 [Trichonephila clavipes]|nr:hypothetical protein TNCV_2225151 [Trichonephila clavipes]
MTTIIVTFLEKKEPRGIAMEVCGTETHTREERVVSRGAYRSYGVRRNDSDTDFKTEEKRKMLPGFDSDEYKYGPEFFQDDVQHVVEVLIFLSTLFNNC